MEKGHLVVVVVRKRPKLATYVEERSGGTHIVSVDGDERIVDKVFALTEQPPKE